MIACGGSSYPRRLSILKRYSLEVEIMERKLPQVPETTKLGISAAELLMSVLDMFSSVIPIPTEKDLGIDMRAELLDGRVPTGIHYNVQCKGKEECDVQEGKFTYPIKVSTINYWNQQKEPTFLIVVDRSNQIFYWAYPYAQIEERMEEIQKQEHVSIHVQKENSFDNKTKKLPKDMMDILYGYHFNILEKIALLLSDVELESKIKISDSQFDKVLDMRSAVETILSNIRIIQEMHEKIETKIQEAIEGEVEKFGGAINWLDSITEVQKYTRGKRIWDDGGFVKGTTPREIISKVKINLDEYAKDTSREKLGVLIELKHYRILM